MYLDLPRSAAKDTRRLLYELVKIGMPYIVFSPSCEAQNLFGQIRSTLNLLFNVFESFIMGMSRVNAKQHQWSISLDAHKQIVKTMGDTTCECPKGLQFVNIKHLFFQSLFLSNIPYGNDTPHRLPIDILVGTSTQTYRNQISRFCVSVCFDTGKTLACQYALVHLFRFSTVFLRDKTFYFLPHLFSQRPAKHLFKGRIEIDNPSLYIENRYRIRVRFHESPIPLLTFPQCFFSHFALGDVPWNTPESDGFVWTISHQSNKHLEDSLFSAFQD